MLTERFASHAALAAFYRRLLESPNFLAWFERRRGAAWAWQVRAVVTSALHCAGGLCKLMRNNAGYDMLLLLVFSTWCGADGFVCVWDRLRSGPRRRASAGRAST